MTMIPVTPMTSMTPHRIAVIAGDGIGQETLPEGLRVLEAAAVRFGIPLQIDHFDFSSWAYFERHGKMLPDDWKERIGGHDAIFFGAVGWPQKVPDRVSLWGSLLRFRRDFDQYVNLRPARPMPGIRSPLVDRHGVPPQPGAVNLMIVRENTEGEYSRIGWRMYEGTPREVVMQQTVMTSSTSTSCARISCSGRSSSTWWWRAICSATSCRTWARPAPARSASRPRPT